MKLLRVFRWFHGTILGWLYRDDEWSCSCGIEQGGWVEVCGCSRRERRPLLGAGGEEG